MVRRYGADVPRLDGYPGELNQVWTNLIDNAVDAVDGSGTLTITTGVDDGALVVDVTDTGAGMPSQVAAIRVRLPLAALPSTTVPDE